MAEAVEHHPCCISSDHSVVAVGIERRGEIMASTDREIVALGQRQSCVVCFDGDGMASQQATQQRQKRHGVSCHDTDLRARHWLARENLQKPGFDCAAATDNRFRWSAFIGGRGCDVDEKLVSRKIPGIRLVPVELEIGRKTSSEGTKPIKQFRATGLRAMRVHARPRRWISIYRLPRDPEPRHGGGEGGWRDYCTCGDCMRHHNRYTIKTNVIHETI